MSINGWFHTKEPLTFETPIYKPPSDGLYGTTLLEPIEDDCVLADYIDDGYLVDDTVTSIQQYIEEHSEMSLELYFKEEEFFAVFDDLVSPGKTSLV